MSNRWKLKFMTSRDTVQQQVCNVLPSYLSISNAATCHSDSVAEVMLLLVLRLLRLLLLLLLFTLSMMQEFIGVKLLYEDQCTITKRRHLTYVGVCVSLCGIWGLLTATPLPAPSFPLQLWPLRVNYLVIIFPHNAQKFSSPLINWISHAQCGKSSLPPIGKHLSINLQNNAVLVFLCVCVCVSRRRDRAYAMCGIWPFVQLCLLRRRWQMSDENLRQCCCP